MPVYRFRLTMLSPVHIGSGEEIGPHEYIVRPEGDNRYGFYAVDLPAFISSLTPSQRKDFEQSIQYHAPTRLWRFIRSHVDIQRFARYRCATSSEFFHIYQQATNPTSPPRGTPPQLLVNTMIRTGPDARPYIPGSSLKGALRTALLAARAARHPDAAQLQSLAHRRKPHAARLFEAVALQYARPSAQPDPVPEIHADPFRAVKISDAPLPPDAISVDPVRIILSSRPYNRNNLSGIQMYYELTFSVLDDENVRAEGTITIDQRLASHPGPRGRKTQPWPFPNCVATSITIDEILQAANDFYQRRLEDEYKTFYETRPHLKKIADRLRQETSQLDRNEALVRIGRFSHFECVTVGEPYARGRHGSSRSLLGGKYPIGWCRLTILDT